MPRPAKVIRYLGKDGWRFRALAKNGKVVDKAEEPFASKSNVTRAIRARFGRRVAIVDA